MGVCFDYTTSDLGLQSDSSACGFWSIYIGFALLLDFPPLNSASKTMSVHSLKHILSSMCSQFIGDEHGLHTMLVKECFLGFASGYDWNSLKDMVRTSEELGSFLFNCSSLFSSRHDQ